MNDAVSLGVDLGTSELKAVLMNHDGTVLAQAVTGLSIARPQPGWSEQDPEDWWRAFVKTLQQLRQEWPSEYSRIRCIGLAGQMHGAVLIDERDNCVRPAILWNDSRALEESATLANIHSSFASVTGSAPMAGFTAPKLLWIKSHEPQIFASLRCVLSPKDYLRLKLTGERITDVSDAAGTLWLDVAKRTWFEPIVTASGLTLGQLPQIVEGTADTGHLMRPISSLLQLDEKIVVAGGAGDNPASGVAIGALDPQHSFITLGTSAAVFASTDRPMGNPAAGVHTYCHAVPDRWYVMGAILSGASSLRWITRTLGQPSEQHLLDLVKESVPTDRPVPPTAPLFLPYLSGERTPHNDPLARGGFMNLSHETSAAMLGYAVLEGVGFALRDALSAVESTGVSVGACALVGGGARSDYWGQLLSNILDRELWLVAQAELCAAIGAAKLGYVALGGVPNILNTRLPVWRTFIPQSAAIPSLLERYLRFRGLFPAARSVVRKLRRASKTKFVPKESNEPT